MPPRRATTRGFARTASLLQGRIRTASESRGFAVSRLLTQWPEIVGEDIAAIARPVNVTYGRHSLGATLTVLTTGAQAPMLEMQKEKLREKVNAVYGYNAIARVKVTQTAATGFSEGQAVFETKRKAPEVKPTDPKIIETAKAATDPVTDTGLREALEKLGCNVMAKSKG